MTGEERSRISLMRKAMARTEEGTSCISTALVPTASERARFAALRDDLTDRLAVAGTPDERQAIHDRLHGFLMGFAQLRALEAGNAGLMVADFVEAVEEMPVEVVHRACKAWNQRKFTWPNYSFPPTPPDLCRAAQEIRTEMRVERYDLGAILLAKPPEAKPQVSDEDRDRMAAEAQAMIATIAEAGQRRDAELAEGARLEQRQERLAHVARVQAAEAERKARIAARRAAEQAQTDERPV